VSRLKRLLARDRRTELMKCVPYNPSVVTLQLSGDKININAVRHTTLLHWEL